MKAFDNKLPSDVVMKRMLYNSHPVADAMKHVINEHKERPEHDITFYELWSFVSSTRAKQAEREYVLEFQANLVLEQEWMRGSDESDDDDDGNHYVANYCDSDAESSADELRPRPRITNR